MRHLPKRHAGFRANARRIKDINILQYNNLQNQEQFVLSVDAPPSVAEAMDGRPGGLLSVAFFAQQKRAKVARRSEATDALRSLGEGGLTTFSFLAVYPQNLTSNAPIGVRF